MLFVRRFFYYLASSLLLSLLIITAWSSAVVLNFSTPSKPERWLSHSGIYDHLVAYTAQQSQKSQGQSDQGNITSSDTSFSNPEVQKATQAAFTPQVLQSAVNTFLNANYAWLQGKTSTPNFSIDFTQAKTNMAMNLGNDARNRAVQLPKCSASQLLQMENSGHTFDIFTASCLPSGVTPTSVAQTVQQDVVNNQNFLPNPVLTPQNLNQQSSSGQPSTNPNSQPYYQNLHVLPVVYHWAMRLPLLLGALCLFCAVTILLAASTARKGFRRIGTLLIAAGIVTVLFIFAANLAIHHLENRKFTANNVGELQQSLTHLVHYAQSSPAQTASWFAAGFVLAGAITYLYLFLSRSKKNNPQSHKPAPVTPPVQPSTPLQSVDTTSAPQENTEPAQGSFKKPPKPPTLIQL